jgi:hypothetical protein
MPNLKKKPTDNSLLQDGTSIPWYIRPWTVWSSEHHRAWGLKLRRRCFLFGYGNSNLKMETLYFYETLSSTFQFTRHYNPDNITLLLVSVTLQVPVASSKIRSVHHSWQPSHLIAVQSRCFWTGSLHNPINTETHTNKAALKHFSKGKQKAILRWQNIGSLYKTSNILYLYCGRLNQHGQKASTQWARDWIDWIPSSFLSFIHSSSSASLFHLHLAS